jgi:hypothetical protein
VDFLLVSLQQHIGQNWERGPGANDILDLLQTFEQLFFGGAEFH